jgi:phage baseplate assembly protein W
MADTKRIDKITSSGKASEKAPYYSDFYNNFNMHPHNKTLAKYTNDNAVKRAIRNLIMTQPGERRFQPDFGCDTRRFLFENMSEYIAGLIKDVIKESIDKFEPRVRVLDIIVIGNESNNSYEVSIIFEVINNVNPMSISLTLYRVR